jgi:hypothetical protein
VSQRRVAHESAGIGEIRLTYFSASWEAYRAGRTLTPIRCLAAPRHVLAHCCRAVRDRDRAISPVAHRP